MADGSHINDLRVGADGRGGGRRPRVAFSGEEFGFGYQAVSTLARRYARRADRWLADAGFAAGDRDCNNTQFDLTAPERAPLYTKEQALSALRSKKADIAVVPFYSPHAGYDRDTLNLMGSQFTLVGVEQIEATDRLCLAVYEPQMLDLVQSAHPGSGLSSILKQTSASRQWSESRRFGAENDAFGAGDYQNTAGYQLDSSAQYMLRDRIDMVFAGPDAMSRCKSRIDALRGAGITVRPTAREVEPHREMSRVARGGLNPNRMTNTLFDPLQNKTTFTSSMQADLEAPRLYGVIMPFEVAMRNSDFVIIDDEIEDTSPEDRALKTRFLVVRDLFDRTLFDDRLTLTANRTRHWMKRLRAVLDDNARRRDEYDRPTEGVRVLMRFSRDGRAASLGRIEDLLRGFGVRFATSELAEDSGKDAQSPLLLDMEFDASHFRGSPFGPSPAHKVMEQCFARWKKRNARVLAAMPFSEHQLPAPARRRWWKEGVSSAFGSTYHTIYMLLRGPVTNVFMAAALGLFVYGAVQFNLWGKLVIAARAAIAALARAAGA